MRFPFIAAVLSVWLGAAAAFEIEDRRIFGDPDAAALLQVISTTDTDLFAPLITAWREGNPGVAVEYTMVSSSELMTALVRESAAYDVALSSAMDLQTKLANDGLARSHRSSAVQSLPDWANWRDQVFAFTQEPATIVMSPAAFSGLPMPQTRQDLIALLRDYPDRFRGRVGTYDIRLSGLGYLFATQDSRSSESYWRLTEVMGGLDARLYCCSADMIEAVRDGELAVAYNVLGSYAGAQHAAGADIAVIEPEDFTTVMLRSAVIPRSAERPDLGGSFIDHLIRTAWGAGPVETVFSRPKADLTAADGALRPIRIGPGLLVYLDDLKRQRFLEAWENAILR